MFLVDTTESPHAILRPVPLDAVTLTDSFWAPRLKNLREITLPAQFDQIEQTGRLDNFRRAVGTLDTTYKGFIFNDSDVYKFLEAVAWILPTPNECEGDLLKILNTTLSLILSAQQPDGYLNTAFVFDQADQRWSNLRDWHELYCAGHFIQAVIALHRSHLISQNADGWGDELQAALRLADHICATFGPAEQGKIPAVPGHQEIEIALIELYRLTRASKYLTQAQYFLDARGQGIIGGNAYHQDHQPYRSLTRHSGHAVRALYMNIAAADLYMEIGDSTLLDTLTRLWENATTRQMYITGGFGARRSGESFGDDYELPNHRAYAETCAAIASVMWNYRMAAISGNARYIDLLEHTLYNAVLPGIGLDGEQYFYINPLADEGEHRRKPWFSCACCPPNVARLLASLPAYFYNVSVNGVDHPALWIHLYAESTLHLTLSDGTPLTLDIHTSYPWDGDINMKVRTQGTFTLHLRLPAWCPNPTLRLNDTPCEQPITPGTYYKISRTWTDGDTLTLQLPMSVQFIEAHPSVAENTGKIAIQRGPILYCFESVDNPTNLDEISLDLTQSPQIQYRSEFLGGITSIQLSAYHRPSAQSWSGQLYRPLSLQYFHTITTQPISVTAIPYYAWANREPGQMSVWMKYNK